MTGEDKRKVLAMLDKLMEGTSGLVRATIMACMCAVDKMEAEEKWIPVAEKKMTNADRIRAMSDEELENFINKFNFCDIRTSDECKMSYCGCCEVCVMDWLKQPAEGENE